MEDINIASYILKVFKELKDTMRKNMENQFDGMNITAPQGMVIGILCHEGKMPVSELSKKIGLSNSTVSGIVDRLENQEIIQRIRSKEDRRVVFVDVTERFKKQPKDHFNHMQKIIEDILDKATPEELEIIVKGISILERLLRDEKDNKSI